MADLIDITDNILSQNNICFETRIYEGEYTKFGILNFKAITADETKKEIDILFTIDCSGSMSERCDDRRTKMEQIIHTLKNMIVFFYEHPSISVNITVIAFDSSIYRIIERTKVTADNYMNLIRKADNILPRGSTDIELAIKMSAQEIRKIQAENPDNIITHIFMTDGEATNGNTDPDFLKTLVNIDVKNAFIGFGTEHDAFLLNSISSAGGDCGYYFVDKLESAGLIYGEILHGIVYKLLVNAEIVIDNGVVYDFKTNTWVNRLYIGDIVSESNKTYNIKSETPDMCRVNLKADMDGLIVLFPARRIRDDNLEVHIYRQRTLELLYEVNKFINTHKDELFNNPSSSCEEETRNLKAKLCLVLEEIKGYMTTNGEETNKILKNLCDDIYICLRSFDTRYGSMFCAARQTSQGTQRQYAATSINVLNENVSRNNWRRPNINLNEDDDNIHLPLHNLSGFAETPYMTFQTTQVMRDISGINIKIDDDDNASVDTQEL